MLAMRTRAAILAAVLAAAGCDGGGGDGWGGALDDAQADVGPGGDGDGGGGDTGSRSVWTALPGAVLGDVTRVVAFSGDGGALYVSAESPVSEGVFRLDLAAPDAGFAKIFEGTGLTLATPAGTYTALWENKAGALVQVGGEEALDLGFNFEQREIQRMVYADGLLYLLSKDWAAAEYHVNRGSAAAMQWEPVGPVSDETALGFHCDGETVMVVTVRNEIPLGLNCRTVPANAGEDGAWSPCEGFPQHLAGGPNDPYSVKAGITGDGAVLAAWFEVLKAGQKTWEVQTGVLDGSWSLASGLPEDRPPSAMMVHAGLAWIGYSGLGDGAQVFSRSADGAGVEGALALGSGLPEPAGDKTGVAGLVGVDGNVYLLWQDYNAGGSTLTVYGLTP
ncbi:MAG: hypothetical protein FJ098_13785 [Deltaproteobacteria bacterium]|nr:hypothetical protein [Deltaproteobacteria bacterium]